MGKIGKVKGRYPWITGEIHTPAGIIPQVMTQLTFRDVLGTWKVRWNIHRMNYKVPPGLYAVGHPDTESPVLVTANYKMSFDRLRQALDGMDLWILVLDTEGVNVWCAAGKGTFSTAELVEKIVRTKLAEIVNHRTVILPQLGAPGVSAHEVYKASGFQVVYGPVRASDIKEFLRNGLKATPEMREVRFGIIDRLVVTPVELVGTIKPLAVVWGLLFLMNLIRNDFTSWNGLLAMTMSDFVPYLGAALFGAFLIPVLLPWLPGRALSLKGFWLGLVWVWIYLGWIAPPSGWMRMVAYLLLLPSIVSHLAMNFTGSTTYTSLSGVVKEIKIAVPAQQISVCLGISMMMAAIFV